MNIYVGNLSREVTEADLQEAFTAFGQVTSASIIRDKFSNEPRGFGFVEMPSREEAQAAITGLMGKELKGQSLNVSEARPRTERSGGGGRGGGGGRDRRRGGGAGGAGGQRRGGGGGGGRRFR